MSILSIVILLLSVAGAWLGSRREINRRMMNLCYLIANSLSILLFVSLHEPALIVQQMLFLVFSLKGVMK